MGRFYKTALPRFEKGVVHQTPWQLASQVLEKKEKEVDSLFASAELLEGSTNNMNYLQFESDTASQIQDKYNKKVDEITQKIMEDPMNASSYTPALRALKRDIQKDRMGGQWYNLEQRYAAVQNWQKENADMKKTDPGRYRLAQAKFMNDLEESVSADPTAQFQGYKLVNRPDLKGEETRQRFENIKANIMERKGANGMYLYKGESVSPDRVASIAMNELLTDPNFSTFLQQERDLLGDERFEAMGYTQPFFDKTVDPKTNEVTGMSINPNNPFSRDISNAANTYGYEELTVKADPFALENYKQANRMNLLRAKEAYKKKNQKDDRELFPKTMVQQTSLLFSPEQLNDVFYNVYMPGKKKIAEGKDPTEGMSPDQKSYYKKMAGMYDDAVATSGISDNLLEALEMTKAPDNVKYTVEYPTTTGFAATKDGFNPNPRRVMKPEYRQAEKIVEENREMVEKFNTALAGNNTVSYSVLPIDETKSDIGKMYAGEMNQVLSTGAIKTFSPDYAPWKYDGIGYVQPMEITGDDQITTNYIADIAAAEGISPFETFAEGTVRRYRRGGKTYYTGRLKPQLIQAHGLEAAGGANFNGEVTIEVPQNTSTLDQIVMQKYRHNPQMYHDYKMGTDNGYQTTFERMNTVLNFMQNEGNSISPVFKVNNNPNGFKINMDAETGYQLYMERPTGEVLVDRIAVPVYNDQGEVIGMREEMLGNSRQDIFQALNYFNNNPGSYVDPDDEE